MSAPVRGVLVVFAKAPRAGEVKTRMCPPLDPGEAAELQAHLLADVLAASAAFCGPLALEAVLAVHPPSACAALARGAPARFRAVPQRGPDLAARMRWAVREAAAGGARRILLRGSDSPLLDAPLVAAALEALDRHDLVLSPDRDGGYGLVGLRAPSDGLFAHPMSTRSVLEDTLAYARAAGLSAWLGATGSDIDTVEDLRWLARERARQRDACARLCPRTLAFLDARALWPEPAGG